MTGSGLLFSKTHHAAAPVPYFHIRMRGRPFRQFGLRAHHALHRGDIGKYKTAFTAVFGGGCQTGNKKKLYHFGLIPAFCNLLPTEQFKQTDVKCTLTRREGQAKLKKPPNNCADFTMLT